jgi:hypothetical protein
MRKITIITIILLGFVLAWVIPEYTISAGSEDFVKYWAASKLLFEGKNPYDPTEILGVANDVWPTNPFAPGDIIVTWNPPWLLVIFLPFAWLPFHIALRLWIFVSLALIILTVYCVWQLLDQRQDVRGYTFAIFAILTYGNTLYLLRIGQITSLLLACLVVSVFLLRARRELLAGILITMLTVKIQIFYLVLFVLLFWIVREHRWRVMVGAMLTASVATIIACLLYPALLTSYMTNMAQMHFSFLMTSTLGSFAYWQFGLDWVYWLFLVLIPFAWPLSAQIRSQGWLTVLNLAVALSVPLAPYGYSFDHIIYIPLITQLVYWLRDQNQSLAWRIGLGLGYLIVSVMIIGFMSIPLLPYYWLVIPAILLSILYIFGVLKHGYLFSKQLAR